MVNAKIQMTKNTFENSNATNKSSLSPKAILVATPTKTAKGTVNFPCQVPNKLPSVLSREIKTPPDTHDNHETTPIFPRLNRIYDQKSNKVPNRHFKST